MSKKKQKQPEESWDVPFQKLCDEDEEVWDLIYAAEEIKSRKIGFELPQLAYKSFTSSNSDAEENRAILAMIKDKYVVWVTDTLYGDTYYEAEAYEPHLFDTLKEAEVAYEEIQYQYMPIPDEIAACKNAIQDEDLWLQPRYDCPDYSYRVYYQRKLIIEKMKNLDDIERIKEQIRRLKKLKAKLSEYDITIDEIYKPSREWNCNERYYYFSFDTPKGYENKKVHIPSRVQRQSRNVLDYFDVDNFLEEYKNKPELKEMECEWYSSLGYKEDVVPYRLKKERV